MSSSSSSPDPIPVGNSVTLYPRSQKKVTRDNLEGNTVIEYPRSGRRIVKDSKGNVISDSKSK